MKKIKLIKNFSSLFLRANKAQGILEVVIAISIVVVGLVSIMSLVVFNVTTQDYNHDMLIASNLAREGIEVIRSMRDSNWLDSTKDWDDSIFMGDVSYFDKNKNSFIIMNNASWFANDFTYRVYPVGMFWEDCIKEKAGINSVVCKLSLVPLKERPDYKVFDYWGDFIDGSENTNFYRLIYINEICDVGGAEDILTNYAERCADDSKIGMQIISKVGWMNRGEMRTLEVEERLYNWK